MTLLEGYVTFGLPLIALAMLGGLLWLNRRGLDRNPAPDHIED